MDACGHLLTSFYAVNQVGIQPASPYHLQSISSRAARIRKHTLSRERDSDMGGDEEQKQDRLLLRVY